MGIVRTIYKILFTLIFVSGTPAFAAVPARDFDFIGLYQFEWSGIALGSLELGIKQKGEDYDLHLLVNSEGIINVFTRHESDTVANGKYLSDHYSPRYYESHYKTKNKPRHIKFTYDASGKVSTEIVEPPEDPTDRPVVSHDLKDGTYDPLTALMVMRQGNSTKIRVYDAKHLYDITVAADAKEKLRLLTGVTRAQTYTLSRIPVAGMTGKELREYNKGEPPLTFYMSDDKRHIPLGLSLPLYVGRVQGMLWKECSTWNECKP